MQVATLFLLLKNFPCVEKHVRLNDRVFRLYKSESEIIAAVRNVAQQLNDDYIGKRPVLVPILNGSFMFASDLMKELMLDCEICFVKASSYEGTASTGQLKSLIGIDKDLTGRHIIIIEDIVDSGHTLAALLPSFRALGAASLKIATLLLKPEALKVSLHIDYVGMKIPNDFIVGYGLDYDGVGRNLRDIYQVVPE